MVHRAPFIPPRVQRPGPSGSADPLSGAGGPPAGLQQQSRRAGSREEAPEPSDLAAALTAPAAMEDHPAPTRNFGPDAKPATGDSRRKGKKGRKNYVDQEAVQANILKTLQGMKGGSRGKRRSDEPSYRDLLASRSAEEQEKEKTRIRVNEFISVSELADTMKIPATQIVQFAFKELGLMVTVNQRLDFDQIELIASEFGFQAVREDEYAAELGAVPVEDKVEDLRSAAPGGYDHGPRRSRQRLRCSTTSARPTWWRAKPAGSPSTSAPIT